jgi:protein TonB
MPEVAWGEGAAEPQPVDPNLVVPSMPPAPRRRRVAFVVAAGLSVALHASSLLAVLRWREEADFGAVASPSEAISVEIVESKVLEAMLHKQSPEPAPSVEATAPQEGSVDATAAPSEKPAEEPKKVEAEVPPVPAPDAPDEKTRVIQEEAPKTPEAVPLPVEGPGEKKEAEDAATTAKAKEQLEEEAQHKEEEREEQRKEQAKEAERKEREQQAKANSRAGGATSRASAGQGAGGERASASTGALLRYAAHVRARVARNKPAGRGLRGTAVVAFGITESGALAYANIARSSGKPGLDQAALSAVRGAAPFPTPPAGATAAQLQFSIPFQFQ